MAKLKKIPVEIRDEAYELWTTMDHSIQEVTDYFRGQRRPLFDAKGNQVGVGGYDLVPGDFRAFLHDEKVKRQAVSDCEAIKAHRLPHILEGLIKSITADKLAAEDIWRKLPEAEKKGVKGYKLRKDSQGKSMDHLVRLMYVTMPEKSNAPTEEVKAALKARLKLVLEDGPTAPAEPVPAKTNDGD